MFREELTEKGIVVDKCGSQIKVSVINAEHCDDCSAKLICNPSEKGNTIELEYDGEIKNGDQVTLVIKGKNLISLSIILYLFPLVLLVAGIYFGLNFFKSGNLVELYSFFTGLALVSTYYLIAYFLFKRKNQNPAVPDIIRVL